MDNGIIATRRNRNGIRQLLACAMLRCQTFRKAWLLAFAPHAPEHSPRLLLAPFGLRWRRSNLFQEQKRRFLCLVANKKFLRS